jgi:hypothetical protein
MEKMGALMKHIVCAAAILGFLTLGAGASDVKPDPNKSLANDGHQVVEHLPPAGPLDKKILVSPRANLLGVGENLPGDHVLTCLQLQVIDEVDLLGDADCR